MTLRTVHRRNMESMKPRRQCSNELYKLHGDLDEKTTELGPTYNSFLYIYIYLIHF
jgi:hypothetical protein